MANNPDSKIEIDITVKRPSPFSAVLLAVMSGDDLATASDNDLAVFIVQALVAAIKAQESKKAKDG